MRSIHTLKHCKALTYIVVAFLSVNAFGETKSKVTSSKLNASQIKGMKAKAQKVAINTNTVAINSTTSALSGISQVQINSEEKAEKSFSFVTGLEYSAKVSSEENVARESGYDLLLWPMYKINDQFNVAAKAVVSHSNTGAQNTTLSDTTLDLGIKGFEINEQLKSLHSVRVVAPTSEVSREDNRLQTSISTSNGLAYSNPYFTLIYAVRLTKNIHEFTQNKDYSPNLEYGVGQALDFNVPVIDPVYLTLAGSYRTAWTYKGYQRSFFAISGDINLKVQKNFEMNLGFSTDGNALQSNGVDSNIAIYDQNTSVLRAGMSYVY